MLIILFSEPFVLDDSSQFFLPENPGEPQFAEGVGTNVNVTGQLGASVFLHCPVVNSGDRAVSYPSVSTNCSYLACPKTIFSTSGSIHITYCMIIFRLHFSRC